jgi:hypothetical protein
MLETIRELPPGDVERATQPKQPAVETPTGPPDVPIEDLFEERDSRPQDHPE